MSNTAPGYARHPNHRVAISAPEHRITLYRGEQPVAQTAAAIRLEESGYPTRFYLPAESFSDGVLTSSASSSYCPFKGEASYWHLNLPTERLEDAVWGYDAPYDECQALRGYRGFYDEVFRVEVK